MSQLPLPSLNALRAFEATARLGGVGKAAQSLYVTHGAISRQLRLLEEDLGLPLLRRAGRGVGLTPAGQRLFEACGDAFSRIAECVADMRRPAQRPVLVLGCSGSVLARWMIPRLPALQAALPGVALQWSALDGSFTEEQAALDAVLLLAQGPWPARWDVRELGPERVGVVIAPSHPAAARLQHAPPAALLQEHLLHTLSRPQAWPAWAQAHGVDPAQLPLGSAFDHLYYLLEAAVAGLGPAIAPQPLVEQDLAAGRLRAPWGFSDTGGSWVLARPQGPADARIEALADWLAEQLHQGRKGDGGD